MNNVKILNSSKNILLCLLIAISFSGRSFTGLTIFNYRIGELIVGVLCVSSLFIFFYKNQNYKVLILIFRFIVLIFIVTAIFLNEPTYSTYLIQSSSYIWMISLLFISLILSKFIKLDSWFYITYMLIPLFLFYTETFNYPDFMKNFYLLYSDKFDFLKGSDLALVIISAQVLSIIKLKRSYYIFTYIILINSLFLPFLLYKSKGAFLGAFLFFIYLFFKNIRYTVSNLKNFSTFFLGVFIFILSVNHVSQLNLYGEDSAVGYVDQTTSNLESIIDSKNTTVIFSSFYLENGRLYSLENNANWRLEIWQDVIHNLTNQDLLMSGYGYSTIIPEMDVAYRQGTDGSNENVHNFIINILARGGALSLLIYLILILYLFILTKRKSSNFLIIFYIFSVFTISFFDATNESVRYPFIFYTFLGYFINNLDKTYKYKLSN